METMHAAGRRHLPPVPRPSTERTAPAADRAEPDTGDAESPTERFVVDLATGEQRTVSVAAVDGSEDDALEDDALEDHAAQDQAAADSAAKEARAGDASEDEVLEDDAPEDDAPQEDAPEDEAVEDDAAEDVPALADSADLDPAQLFVARLRAAAADFAEAAGAESAVVREAVPPARHRRARCRLVLRYADESEVDVTFLGPAGRPGTPSRHGFDRQIRRWLNAGQRREDAWLVADEDALDGLAVDLSAWVAAA